MSASWLLADILCESHVRFTPESGTFGVQKGMSSMGQIADTFDHGDVFSSKLSPALAKL